MSKLTLTLYEYICDQEECEETLDIGPGTDGRAADLEARDAGWRSGARTIGQTVLWYCPRHAEPV